MAYGLKQQGTLAGARMAAHQDCRPLHQAATENPVELLHTGTDTRLLGEADVVQALDFRQAAGKALEAGATSAFGAADTADFADGIPGLAGGALALPFGVVGTAFGADIGGFYFGHGDLRG